MMRRLGLRGGGRGYPWLVVAIWAVLVAWALLGCESVSVFTAAR